MAAAHIGQGSQVVAITSPDKSIFCSFAQAPRRQLISAWAVMSQVWRTTLWAAWMSSPSGVAMAAPKGELPAAMPCWQTSMAWVMICSGVVIVLCPVLRRDFADFGSVAG